MNTQHVEIVVIGAGQAGLSMSYYLTQQGREHLVLEQGRVGEAWRKRCDSSVLVAPNWTVQLPAFPYQGNEPDGFMSNSLRGKFPERDQTECHTGEEQMRPIR
jgi:putative flavoprotein involved in K+ transport